MRSEAISRARFGFQERCGSAIWSLSPSRLRTEVKSLEAGAIPSGAGGGGKTVYRPIRLPHLKEREAGPDLVVYDPHQGRMHVLNVTAAFIWRQCDGTKSQDEMLRNLESEFRIEALEQTDREVAEILRSFSEQALVEDADSPPAKSRTEKSQSGGQPPRGGSSK